jgi:acyl-CoA synthetase (AMP-forming)/AMP-acid ligase II
MKIFRGPYETRPIPDTPLTQFVLQKAADIPDKPALIDGPTGRTITYGQLAGAIRLVAASLHQRGFGKGDAFCICSPNIPEYAIAFHAVALIGGIVSTANPLYTAKELAFQLTDSRSRYILTIPMFMEKVQEAVAQSDVEEIFVFGEADGATPFASLLESDGQVPDVDFDTDEDLVVLPYSSGTTGLPKGVMLSHRNLVGNIVQILGIEDLSEDEVVLGILPFFHIFGMLVILNVSLYHGATIVTMPRFDLEEFLGLIQSHKITRASLVPPIVLALAKHPMIDDYDLSSLKVILSGAAPLSDDLSRECAERLGCVVKQGYGLTETSPATHVQRDDPASIKLGSVGNPVPNTDVRVVSVDSGEDLGANERGEIWIRGPQIMKGYLNNPEATAQTVDPDGFLHTGDIGYVDDDGDFFIVDRVKELIKYKGYQVAPAELEALLLTHPSISDAAVIPVANEEAGEIPKAFVVLNGDIMPESIMAWVADQVAPHKKIRAVEITDQIPKSASGKILRRVLVDQERAKLA